MKTIPSNRSFMPNIHKTVQKTNFHSPNKTHIHKRPIAHFTDLKGTYRALLHDQKNNSPLFGAAFSQTGALQHQYNRALIAKNPSPLDKLTKDLFYKLGDQFRATENKSNPAYILTPELLALVMHHVDDGTLNNLDVRKTICDEWKKQFKLSTGGKISETKINGLLDTISMSMNDPYLRDATKTLLLSFLYHKSTKREDIIAYLTKLDNLKKSLVDKIALKPTEVFSAEDIKKGLSTITRVGDSEETIHHDNFEEIVMAMFLNAQSLQQVKTAYYSYKGKPDVPNCVETGYHNLCNILLYNEKTHLFDFSLLPKTLKPNTEFLSFYEQLQNNQINKINTKQVGQAFFDLVSGLSFIDYGRDGYEINVNPDNFVPLMNHLFGSSANSFEELSQQFSDEKRQIQFSRKKSIIFIQITIPNKEPETLMFEFKSNHAELVANQFNNKIANLDYGMRSFFLPENYASLSMRDAILPILYALSNNYSLEYQRGNLRLKDVIYLFQHFHPKNSEEAYVVIKKALPYCDNPIIQDSIRYLNTVYPALAPIAVSDQDEKMLLTLLQHGADPNAIAYGDTALHLAALRNLTTFVHHLLQAGANPTKVNMYGKTPLTYATMYTSFSKTILTENERNRFVKSRSETIEALLNAGASLGEVSKDNLERLLLNENTLRSPNLVQKILETGIDPNIKKETVINPIIKINMIDNGRTPLHQADQVDTIKILLKYGADPNATAEKNRTPLYCAVSIYKNNALDLVKALIEGGADPNLPVEDAYESKPLPLIVHATMNGQAEVINYLLNSGQKMPNFSDYQYLREDERFIYMSSSNSPFTISLSQAVRLNMPNVVKALCKAGFVTPNTKDMCGLSMLHIAIEECPSMVDILLKIGADPNIRDGDHKTPIYYAKTPEAVALLAKKGANLNIRDGFQKTPICYAKTSEIVAALLKAGADPFERDIGEPPTNDDEKKIHDLIKKHRKTYNSATAFGKRNLMKLSFWKESLKENACEVSGKLRPHFKY